MLTWLIAEAAINATSAVTAGQMLANASALLFSLSPIVMIIIGALMLLFVGRIGKLLIQLLGVLLIIVGILALLNVGIPL